MIPDRSAAPLGTDAPATEQSCTASSATADPPDPRGPGSGKRLAAMLSLAAVLALMLFVYPVLLDFPLLDPAEGFHAAVAQEMVEDGDWITPRFLGEPFLDKPILYFWAEAFSLRLFGMHEAALRLPGLLFGLLGAIATGIVGGRMFGWTVGWVAGLCYATMILPTALAQAAAHDVALVPWVCLAVLLFWESDRAASRRGAIAYTLAIGLFLGLACLTKGLVGVALVGVSYGSYLLATRRLTLSACVRGAAALLVGALVASPWYVPMELRSPGYLYYFFIERHFLGYTTNSQTHGGEPWWYYLPLLLGGGLPWIGHLPATIQETWIRWKQRRQQQAADPSHGATVLLWCWLIGNTLFLSVSSSKLLTYVWPVFPAVAILAAVAWARLIEGLLSKAARRTLARLFLPSCAAGPALLPVVMLVVQSIFDMQFTWPVWIAATLGAASSWLPLWFWRTGRFRVTFGSATLSIATQFVVVMTVVLPHVANTTSARDLAKHFNRLDRLPPKLVIAEERIGSIVFYLDRDLRAGLRVGQIEQAKLAQFPALQSEMVVALPERRVGRAGGYFDLGGVPYQHAGRYRVYRAADLQPRVLTAAGAAGGVIR